MRDLPTVSLVASCCLPRRPKYGLEPLRNLYTEFQLTSQFNRGEWRPGQFCWYTRAESTKLDNEVLATVDR